ncbi:MAG: AAA family ATPase, partial [Gammaproteobacteria bacterium]
ARQPESAAGSEEFRGLVISEPEIDAMVQADDFFGERWRLQQIKQKELRPVDGRLVCLRAEIDERRRLAREAGIPLSLPRLAKRFKLSPAEVDVLLIALAPELELRYETLYAYLQNDVTRKRPSIDLALNLICRSEHEKIQARSIFDPQGRLLRHRLLDLGEESHDRQPSLLRKFFKMDEAVVGFLLDQPPVAASLGMLINPEPNGALLEVEPATRARLENLAKHFRRTEADGIVIRLIGQSETGLRDAAEVFCGTLGRQILLVERSQLDSDESRLTTLMRNAVLWDAVLAVSTQEADHPEAESQRRGQVETLLWHVLRAFHEPVLLLGPAAAYSQIPSEARVWRLEVTSPGFSLRQRAWESAASHCAASVDPAGLADTFHFGGRRIRQTLDLATSLAALRDPSEAQPTAQDLLEAGRALTAPHVGRFAVPIEPRYTWADIVLPPEKTQQLDRIAAWMRFRRVVHQDWGFGEKLSRGKGLNILFTGPSGTGKTMAAEVLAGELALDLFQIDLASVVSKYIGETEKNLSAIFSEAEQSQALLF